jgi:lipopolysaccharide transport system permease protein
MKLLNEKQRYWLDLILVMTEKEIKSKYKRAIFGFLWMFLQPLLQMAILGFIFNFFVPVSVDNYFLYLFSGLLAWNFFSMSVLTSTPMFVTERKLIAKAKFPRESIILSTILSNLFHLFISLLILMTLLIGDKLFIENYNFLELLVYFFRMWLIIPVLLWLAFITGGFSLLFSTLNVKYRDMSFIVQAGMPLWFYASPIIYSLDLLPEFLYPLFYLNPITGILELLRFSLLNISITSPSLILLGVTTSAVTSYFGIYLFIKKNKNFDDWL